jgi:ubiquitin-like domain-containing CTD phosphatase 1
MCFATCVLYVQDLGRNFVLNPNNGIKVKAYHRTHERAAADCELELLARYLLLLAAKGDSFSRDHSDWRDADGVQRR